MAMRLIAVRSIVRNLIAIKYSSISLPAAIGISSASNHHGIRFRSSSRRPSSPPPQSPLEKIADAAVSSAALSPLLQYWNSLKRQYPDYLIFIRLGDFFEMFGPDAIDGARILGITLTKRNSNATGSIPMCGIPASSLESHVGRLLAAKRKVAIVDQVESVEAARKRSQSVQRGSKSADGSKLVRREVVRFATPGTIMEDEILKPRENNFLLAIHPILNETSVSSISSSGSVSYDFAWLDISTGEFRHSAVAGSELINEIARLEPAEILISQEVINEANEEANNSNSNDNSSTASAPLSALSQVYSQLSSIFPFSPLSPDQFHPISGFSPSSSAIHQYISFTQPNRNPTLSQSSSNSSLFPLVFPSLLSSDRFLSIDAATRRALELTKNVHTGTRVGSLLAHLDRTKTASGARLLTQFIQFPLLDTVEINSRLDSIEYFNSIPDSAINEFQSLLQEIPDVERSFQRLQYNRAGPRELQSIQMFLRSLKNISIEFPRLFSNNNDNNSNNSNNNAIENTNQTIEMPELIKSTSSNLWNSLAEELLTLLNNSLLSYSPLPISPNEGNFIQPEFNEELKYSIENKSNYNQDILNLLEEYRQFLQIPQLNIKYKITHGYYISIPIRFHKKFQNSIENLKLNEKNNNEINNNNNVSASVTKKTNSSSFEFLQQLQTEFRYRTPELMKLESNSNAADQLIKSIELRVFRLLTGKILLFQSKFHEWIKAISMIDVLLSLAIIAREYQYVRPIIHPLAAMKNENNDNNNNNRLLFEIVSGRHPVMESIGKFRRSANNNSNQIQTEFIGNNCNLTESSPIVLLTGANMSGKSVYLRQNALIAVLGQLGSFVPASRAEFSLVDKIFSRIGSGDNWILDESTFLVEMNEIAVILSRSTRNSLLLIDEIGRGTSNRDGLAIARAILEYFHDQIGARCLFATHFQEILNYSRIIHNEMKTNNHNDNSNSSLSVSDSVSSTVSFTVSEPNFSAFPLLRALHFRVDYNPMTGNLLFFHKIKSGIADGSYGVQVAKLANLPDQVVNRAQLLSKFVSSK